MLTTCYLDVRNRQIKHILITDPEQKRSFSDVTAQAQDSLSRLTLRQLRLKASELGVPLYSRKSKAALINEITSYKRKSESNKKIFEPFWRAPKQSGEVSSSQSSSDTRVVFIPRDPQWSYVFWEISEQDRKKALSQGANRLSLRLSDVTGSIDGTANRQTFQEVQVDSHSTEWYLPIPMSDRDYRVELGYRSESRWISLAFSSSARVPSLNPSVQILDQFVPFNLETTPENTPELLTVAEETRDTGLHERLYQTATTHIKNIRIGSEEFQEGGLSQSFWNDSGVGIWASGINESGIGGVPSSNRGFWLVADAELIVYGSTDPSAKLTIADQEVPLSNDGTFRLQVPFRDGVQQYPIEATVHKGSQKRNITMQFERITPEDNTNPSQQNKGEWF